MARTKMTEAEKTEVAAVRDYLKALEQNAPRRGRRRTPESVERQLAVLEGEMGVPRSPSGSASSSSASTWKPTWRPSRRPGQSTCLHWRQGSPPTLLPTVAVGASPTPHGGKSACRRRPSSRPASAAAPDLPPRLIRPAGVGAGRLRRRPAARRQARSGWGISPTTLRPSLQTPAMSSTDPFGLST